ncbi:MAG: hydrogenase expression/formation protein [Planctomycetes bacterium]|nr:hydrogenase expression/formation protein [Planctomycetota bacterium]
MGHRFSVGKLDWRLLDRLLRSYRITDRRVVIGPRVGEDAAVIDFGKTYLVAKTDPITFATDKIGWYAVNINANDIATMGARPKWLLATALLPERKTNRRLVEGIFKDLIRSCDELGITLCGGHTEITYGLDRPIVVGQMLGEVRKDKLVRKERARPGDAVILTKGIAIEGTSIMARERQAHVRRKFGPRFLGRAQRFLVRPGISVVQEALLACQVADVHAMHDPTEGGLATGLFELAKAACAGIHLEREKVKVFPECAHLCAEFGLDPLGLIASGALLIVVRPGDAPKVLRVLRSNAIDAAVIGTLMHARDGLTMTENGARRPLPSFPVDEISKLF